MAARHPSRRRRRRTPSAALRVLLLGLFLVAAHGALPSPILVARLVGRAHERFPCDQHACGCWTAAQCWDDCCCFSPDERLAWAIREGAPIPPTARGIGRLARRVVPHAPAREPADDCPLCVHDEPDPEPAAPIAPSIGPLGCQGLATWLVLSVPPMVVPVTPSADTPPVQTLHRARRWAHDLATPPLDPPPPRA